MSYILEALTKAERERKRGQVPVLDGLEPVAAAPEPRNPWLWVALFAVVFNAVLAGLLIYASFSEDSAPPAVPAAVTQRPVVAPAPPAEAPLAPPAVAIVEPATPPVSAPTLAPAVEADIRKAEPLPARSALPLMTDAELQQQARELAIEQDVESAAIEPPAPAEEEPPPPAASQTPLDMLPLITEMSVDLQQALRTLRLDVHVYDDQTANRFVMINLRRYREGDKVNDDLYLERITREGMVLIWRGQRFRWLNKG